MKPISHQMNYYLETKNGMNLYQKQNNMSIYTIERQLSDKADKWELHNVQNENRELKNQINELERKIGQLESVNSNRYYALEQLFNILAEHPEFSDVSDQLYTLRSNL
jgi:uncharacterized protein YlxW (UPF0749 family)